MHPQTRPRFCRILTEGQMTVGARHDGFGCWWGRIRPPVVKLVNAACVMYMEPNPDLFAALGRCVVGSNVIFTLAASERRE